MDRAVETNLMFVKGNFGSRSITDGIYKASSNATLSATDENRKNIASSN